MKIVARRKCLLAVVAGSVCAAMPALGQTVSPFTRSVFDQDNQTINNGNGYIGYTNNTGSLSQGETYLLNAYMTMYQTTGSTTYLNDFVTGANYLLTVRDDVDPKVYNGTTYNAPLWSQGPNFIYESSALSTGLILDQFVNFAQVVNSTPSLSAYATDAAQYVTETEQSANYLNAHFEFAPDGSTPSYTMNAYHIEPDGQYPDSVAPLDAPNSDSNMGRVDYGLYQITGNAQYLTLADNIARTIASKAFFIDSAGNQVWGYEYNDPSVPEDFSHGDITAPFVSELALAGQVFTAAQAKSIANAIITQAYQGGGQISAGIDGTSAVEEAHIGDDPTIWAWGMAGGFLTLSQFDMRLIPIAQAVQYHYYATSTIGGGSTPVGWPMESVADLVRIAGVPQQTKATNIQITGQQKIYSAAKVIGNLSGPQSLVLVNTSNPSDTQTLIETLGGTGNETTRQWQLSLVLDASQAPSLVGDDITFALSLLDGYANYKQMLSVSLPAGWTYSLNTSSSQIYLSGILASTQEFFFNANETTVAAPVTSSLWNLDSNGKWTTDVNWTSNHPAGINTAANFLSAISGARTITVDSNQTVGSITFNNSNSYALAGPGRLTMQTSTGTASIHVITGSHAISAPLTFANDTILTVDSSGDTLSLTGGISAAGFTTTKTGAGTVAIGGATNRFGNLLVQQGNLRFLANMTTPVRMSSLSVSSGTTLDLTNNSIIVDYTGTSPLGTLAADIGQAYNKGQWNQPGILSSTAATNKATAIGIADNSSLANGSFKGQTISDNDVLICYTWYGDANLDGKVNSADLNRFAPNGSAATWSTGDFNYDGIINNDDFSLFLLGAAMQTGSYPQPVPEPAGIAVVAISMSALRRYRCERFSGTREKA